MKTFIVLLLVASVSAGGGQNGNSNNQGSQDGNSDNQAVEEALTTTTKTTTTAAAAADEDEDSSVISAGDYDSDGICDTWDEYTSVTAGIESAGYTALDDFDDLLLTIYQDNYCENQNSCPSDGDEECDDNDDYLRVDSWFYSTTVTYEGEERTLIATNGIPDHCYQVDQELDVGNYACEHYSLMLLPTSIDISDTFTSAGMGAWGISVSGAHMYNHESAEDSCDAAVYSEGITMDPCDGHADIGCMYHYHKAPVCMDECYTCGLIGYIMDGVPVYGYCNVQLEDGTEVSMTTSYLKNSSLSGCDTSHYTYTDGEGTLDEANGYYFSQAATSINGDVSFEAGDYAYFFSQDFPFIMPGTFVSYESNSLCMFRLADLETASSKRRK